jgi:hypothetical protein
LILIFGVICGGQSKVCGIKTLDFIAIQQQDLTIASVSFRSIATFLD